VLLDRISNALPQGYGFLRSYVEYAAQCSDAPEIYHVGVGLTILSGAIAKKLPCPWIAGRALIPNLYTLLVGPSRASRKTGSMDAGIDILQTAQNELVIPIPGSYEELVTQIRSTPSGLLTYREFGHFLKTTQRGYGEPLRTVLMDLYDWPPDRPYVRNLRKAKTIVEPPICLSMLSSIATDLLFQFSDTEDWTGGFLGRMLLLYGERDTFKMPVTWSSARQQLIGLLHGLAHYPVPACGGFSPQAWQQFSQWSQWRDGQTVNAPARMQTHISGATTLAAKVALLYSADAGEVAAGNGWLVSYESLRRAVLFVEELYIPSIMHLGDRLALGIWERDRQKVVDAVTERGQVGITRRDLLKRVRMESTFLETIINTLREEGTIVSGSEAKGQPVYRAATNGFVPPPRVGTVTPIDQATAP
jgi:hypothetical protein